MCNLIQFCTAQNGTYRSMRLKSRKSPSGSVIYAERHRIDIKPGLRIESILSYVSSQKYLVCNIVIL